MEVCVDSVASAINAQNGGAVRIELCSNLMEGGTTPSIGMLQVIKQAVSVPVFVMIRPRGGDFLYNEVEFEVMKQDLLASKSLGADGFVFGILNRDGTVDAFRCKELIELARPLPVTFHRAIDVCCDIDKALDCIISLRCERVLTSGGDTSALEGLPVIKQMIDRVKGRIIIMPGGGINERNLERILEGTGAKEFHCSARSSVSSQMSYRKEIPMGSSISQSEFTTKIADEEKVRKFVNMADNLWDSNNKHG
ncbi:hypothetical protein ScPMuIL_000629 [Solemya velum]